MIMPKLIKQGGSLLLVFILVFTLALGCSPGEAEPEDLSDGSENEDIEGGGPTGAESEVDPEEENEPDEAVVDGEEAANEGEGGGEEEGEKPEAEE